MNKLYRTTNQFFLAAFFISMSFIHHMLPCSFAQELKDVNSQVAETPIAKNDCHTTAHTRQHEIQT